MDIPVVNYLELLNVLKDRANAVVIEKGDDGKLSVLEIVEHVAKATLDVVELLGEPVDDTD